MLSVAAVVKSMFLKLKGSSMSFPTSNGPLIWSRVNIVTIFDDLI